MTIENTYVYDTTGEKLGCIEEVIVNPRSGKVSFAVFKFGGLLRTRRYRYPIPWETLRYDEKKRGYVTPLDRMTLKNAPRYTYYLVPSYDAEYGERINSYYDRRS